MDVRHAVRAAVGRAPRRRPPSTRFTCWLLAGVSVFAVAAVHDLGAPAVPTGSVNAAAHQHPGAVPVPAAAVTAAVLPRTGWTVTADSAETAVGDYSAARAVDGDPATFWHTRWGGGVDPLPHTFTVDLHADTLVSGVGYLPRPAATGGNGRIGRYEVRLSTDGTTWGAAVATGTLADDATRKTVSFDATVARYVRLTALSEAGGRGGWTSAAEIDLLGGPEPALPRTGWTATADSAESARENGDPANVLDGDPATFWHSRWSSTPADPLPHTITLDMHTTNRVSGLSYLPRPAATGGNGRIGRYEVRLSTDGTTWGAAVATGTFADDATRKTVTFTSAPARSVRLTALSEAGGRGPWSSAAELDVLGTVPTPAGAAGSWGATVSFPLVPVAAALLPNNKLLTWSSYLPDNFGGTGRTVTATMDLGTGVVTQRTVTETGHDMFCPGIAVLSDGRVLVNGGGDSGRTSLYDPATDAWTASGAMTIPRGYEGDTTLSDGRVLTLGGSWSGGQGGKDGEVWSPATDTWTKLPGVPVTPILTADAQGVYRADNHGWLFSTAGGRVFHAGPSKAMHWIDTAGSGSITDAGPRGTDGDAMNGNAVMYDVGKILTVGGAPSYQNNDATANANVIDLSGGTATVRPVPSMSYARAFANSVVLPDGKVLVLGGEAYPVPFSDNTSVLNPELWDPATQRFSTMATMAVPRNYHSVALLLPDGRVFSGGGGLCGSCGTNHFDGQIFTPPYLLNPDGSAASRPTISTAPATATAGTSVPVTTDRAVASFSLVRTGATTHSVDNDQRRIPLTPSAVTGTTYTLPLPADRGVLLPGYYLLFALDANGVPSVAATVRVS